MATKAGVPLVEGVDVANSIAAVYTVPATLARVRVDNITFHNYSGGGVTLTVQIVESGGSTGNAKIVVDNVTIAANSTLEPSSVLHGLNTGDTIQAVAGSATSINCRATGTTFTS